MNGEEQIQNINFSIDKNNLYREESLTDLKVGSIRRLIPLKSDGNADDRRFQRWRHQAGPAVQDPAARSFRLLCQ